MNYSEQALVEDSITLTQYGLMCHVIGFERGRVRYGKYDAYRNHFCCHIDSDRTDWNNIIRNNLATKKASPERKNVYYSLTNKGIELIARREGCKIVEDN